MIIVIGFIVVIGSVLGGFIMGGGNLAALVHPNELIIIAGGALGAMVVMSPRKVLMDMVHGLITCLKGSPHSRAAYDELLKLLYELFLLGRRNGMIALEEHVMEPQNSAIFQKYPLFSNNHHAMEFLCGSLRPIIDGKIKPDQLRLLLDVEIGRMEEEHHAPVNVLTKTGDAMPGFGIVAAVLGIVITMASISGPVEKIGEHVAAALVGTFLGILLAYGFISPLATNLEFVGAAELDYTRCIAACVTGFAGGMAPVTAVELGRRGLSSELRPTADEMEQMFKALKTAAK
ncbi:MAG TPA: flagellar motor stator protein MotA [Verrucomicrobiae bacterium]|jgi:chemotaxis protein MotA|nr:flagellar motor stator protein MotA [Verrucomicrobiae bacterium]